LAQAVFHGIGAYATAITITKFCFSFWLALPKSMLTCIIVALLFSFIAGKERELHFSLVTLALQINFFSVVYNWIPVTNGPYGISAISKPEIFRMKINTPAQQLESKFASFLVLFNHTNI